MSIIRWIALFILLISQHVTAATNQPPKKAEAFHPPQSVGGNLGASPCSNCAGYRSEAMAACNPFGAYNDLFYACFSHYVSSCPNCGSENGPYYISERAAKVWGSCQSQCQCGSQCQPNTIDACKACVAPTPLVCGTNWAYSQNEAEGYCPDVCKNYQDGQKRQYYWNKNVNNQPFNTKGYQNGVKTCPAEAPNCGCNPNSNDYTACNCYVQFRGEHK